MKRFTIIQRFGRNIWYFKKGQNENLNFTSLQGNAKLFKTREHARIHIKEKNIPKALTRTIFTQNINDIININDVIRI